MVEEIQIKKKTIYLIIGILIVIGIGYVFMDGDGNVAEEDGMVKVKLETNKGDIVIELYSEMPVTAGNFRSLVENGVYDEVIFHRIIEGFMIQGGDPTGTGMGDPAIPKIKDEFTDGELDKNNRGTISMANAGPNTGSSQFFINLVDNNFLDGKHPVFGRVVEGMDVVDDIAKVETGAGDRPVDEVKIIKASVL
jgi:peptidylprolyl isomerase